MIFTIWPSVSLPFTYIDIEDSIHFDLRPKFYLYQIKIHTNVLIFWIMTRLHFITLLLLLQDDLLVKRVFTSFF